MASRAALRRVLSAASQSARGAATRAPHAAQPALEAATAAPRHALGGRCAPSPLAALATRGCAFLTPTLCSLRGFATGRSRSPREISRTVEALRRKREALAAAQETETQEPPPPLSSDVARAAVGAGGSLAPHAATEVAFTPVRRVQTLRLNLAF